MSEISEIKEILRLSLEEAFPLAKELRSKSFQDMMGDIYTVNGYLLKPKCGGDCRFCGWNYNVEPGEERQKLTNEKLEELVIHASASILIVNNSRRITERLLNELAVFSWACEQREIGVNIGFSSDLLHFQTLREIGFDYYANDLETSPKIFPTVVTSHSWEDKITSLRKSKEAGLRTISGFILGLGETDEDLKEIFAVLKDLEIEGIVVNFYSLVKGVTFESFSLSPEEVLRRLCQIRIAFPKTPLILGGGRKRWLNEKMARQTFQIVDTRYVGDFLNHPGPYWDREQEVLASMGMCPPKSKDLSTHVCCP